MAIGSERVHDFGVRLLKVLDTLALFHDLLIALCAGNERGYIFIFIFDNKYYYVCCYT